MSRQADRLVVFDMTAPTKLSERLKRWAKGLKRDGLTLWFACKHPATPWYAKALGAFVVAYALSPIDLIPDFIPVLGYLDDLLLLPGLIFLVDDNYLGRLQPTSRQLDGYSWLKTQQLGWRRSHRPAMGRRGGHAVVLAGASGIAR